MRANARCAATCWATTRRRAPISAAPGRPVALRGPNSHSVILAVFHNAGYDQTVTLAQVFWLKDPAGQPLRLYAGDARGAVRGFPANVNVSVALSLAGIGPDRTQVEVWADPTVTRNTHSIHVEADSASFRMTIENIPSDNPKTGRITALSLIACLRKMHAPLRVGS